MIRCLALLLLASSAALAQGGRQQRRMPDPADVPTLIVLITIDQFRADYLERFGGELTGGLRQLIDEGAVFTNAVHDHAITQSAPGHASLLSGRYPRSTGIFRDDGAVLDPQEPILQAPGTGASPFRFRGTTLVDWLRSRDPRSRAFSVGGHDRGAILMVGRQPQQVYWYAPNGAFTTSTYYADTLPTWVRQFNGRRLPQGMAGERWMPLRPDSQYTEPDSIAAENGGRELTFPHTLPRNQAQAAAAFPEYPWMDLHTLNFALHGLRTLRLGSGPQTDLLAISLSATEAIGRRFGPGSRELHDQILRLDRALGQFLDTLLATRGSQVVVALTSDHGVGLLPQQADSTAPPGARPVDATEIIEWYRYSLGQLRLDSTAFHFDNGLLLADRAAFSRAGVKADSTIRSFAAEMRRVPGVVRVDTRATLARDSTRSAVARRWAHSLPTDIPAEVMVTLRPGHVWGKVTYAANGSPYDYDTKVPIILFGLAFKPGRYTQAVRVVDLAPTLAWVSATAPGERLDGRMLWAAVR
ncbi:MAG TPA: alkaline phosphatase family protein [Gemmatimonadaceae bacterium]|nr:alkaline phosphatase family protein [Gemmatimonadaceae bacterium]